MGLLLVVLASAANHDDDTHAHQVLTRLTATSHEPSPPGSPVVTPRPRSASRRPAWVSSAPTASPSLARRLEARLRDAPALADDLRRISRLLETEPLADGLDDGRLGRPRKSQDEV